jgi:hypothetical protein
VLWLLLACTQGHVSRFDFHFEPQPTEGHIVVMPFVGVFEEPALRLDAGLADRVVSEEREETRRKRTRDVRRVPSHIGTALPGQVAVVLGDAWHASFALGRFPTRTRERLTQAIRGRADLDAVLAEIGRTTPADGVWVSWVESLEGNPLTSEADPGEVLVTPSGPVIVDFTDEPYRVDVRMGMALVAGDGEVVVRYEDDFEAVLSGSRDPRAVGSELARQLARDVAAFWPTDPRLRTPDVAEPEMSFDADDVSLRRPEVMFHGRPPLE